MEFEDFELRVTKEGSSYGVSVTESPAGIGESTFFFDKKDEKMLLKLHSLVFADEFDEKMNDKFSRELGSFLFEKLFSGDVKPRFHESLGAVQQEGKGLRITVTLPEELQLIPWEFLYDTERKLFLSRSSHTILARLPEVPHPPEDISVYPPLKILIAVSHPLDILGTEDEFDVERERNVIEKALEKLESEEKIFFEVLDIVNVENLLEKLRKGFDVLHFIGHGVIGGLLIEGDKGESCTISSEKFAELLEGKGLKLVLLESCWSSAGKGFTGIAPRLLLTGAPAVIAMQHPILVKSAEIFFSEFYKWLASGYGVDESVSEARKAVYAHPGQNCLDWATPTLYMNCHNGVIFSVEEPKPLPERHDYTELYTAAHFVGRREEIWKLKKALSGDKRIVVIEGFAGIGKSVLVSKVIKDVLSDFKGVFAVRCTEGYSLDLFFARLNQFFLNHGEHALNVGLPSEEKIPLLLNVLRSKYLIILDNFEVLLENGVKKDFEILLESLLIHRHKGKILITTRRSFNLLKGRLSGNIEHIVLGGLSPKHSLWLMQELGISESLEDMGRIYEKTGGHPFAIEFVKGLMREEPLEKILELPISREDILDLLKEVFEKLEPEELFVLKQISVLRRPEYIEALEFLASDKKRYVRHLLGKTVLFYDKRTELYYLHALIREYTYEQLEDKRKAHLRAAKYYEEAVKITKDMWDVVEAWYHNFEAGEYKKAEAIVSGMAEYLLRWGYWQLLKEMLEKTAETTEGSLQGLSLHRLGIVYQYLGEYGKALEHYEESLKIFKKVDDKPNISASLHQIGIIQYLRGDYNKALEYYERGLEIAEELGDKSVIATSLHEIGIICQDRGDYNKALEYYERGLEIAEELGDKSAIVNSLGQIGIIQYLRGDYNKALEYYERSLEIAEELGDKSGIAKSLHQIGMIQYLRGDYNKALEYYERSLELKEELGDKSGIATSLHQIGIIQYLRGDYNKALEYYERSLELKEELGDKSGIATSLHQIGIIHQDRGDYNKALEYYERSLKIAEELGDKSGIATSLHQIGMIHQDRGDYNKALEYYERSLKIKEELRDKSGIAISLHQIGTIQYLRGDYNKALEYCERSLKIAEELGDKSGIATSLGQMSKVYFSLKDYETCLKLNLIAIKIFEYLGSPYIEIARADVDKIHQELGDDKFQEIVSRISNEVEAELNRLGITL